MNPFVRWFKFNVVGAMGMAVQLTALAILNRLMADHYLYASAIAIELTLLHNFLWHLHFTWRDRRNDSTPLRQFVRFHLSNGLVSMLGNLSLVRLLVHTTHLPLLLSNAIAILCCSIANFCLGNNWAFAQTPKAGSSLGSTSRLNNSGCSIVRTLLLLLAASVTKHDQPIASAPALKSAVSVWPSASAVTGR
jgi:putative flippase GtrA